MASKQPTLLVVEDELLLLKSILLKAQKKGLNAISATSVEETIKILEQDANHIGCIWLDYFLSGSQTGLDLMEKIHAHKVWSKIPVIIVSNTATEEKVQAMMTLGAKKYFLKAEHLLAEILEYVQSLMEP